MNKLYRRRNISDMAIVGQKSVGATAVILSAANESRMYCAISIGPGESSGIWVRAYAASVDDTKKGEYVSPGETWRMYQDMIYCGELSAVSESGDSVAVSVNEY